MTHRTFTPFPILTTERLTLRELSLNDAQHIFALRSDREVNKYLDREPSKTIDEAIHFIHKIRALVKNNESVYWAITLTENSTFAGAICLYAFSDNPDKCEIGYELLSDFQGKGIMHEAANKVLGYAVQILNIQIIEALTHKNNIHSIKLLEKLDFKKSIESDKVESDYTIFTFG